MATLVKDFLLVVGQALQDLNPQFRRWPERELVVYTNYAQRAIAKYLPQAGARTDVIQLAAGTKQDFTTVAASRIKPGVGLAEDAYGIAFMGFTRNMGADGLTPGRAIRPPVDRYTQDAGNPDWHTAATGTVVREVFFDKAHPLVAYVSPPVPASPQVWVEVQWMAEPNRVPPGGAAGNEVYGAAGSSTQVLGIRDQFVEDAHHYVVAMALLKGSKNTQNLPKGQTHASIFTASINAQAARLSGVNPNLKALPFANEIPEGH